MVVEVEVCASAGAAKRQRTRRRAARAKAKRRRIWEVMVREPVFSLFFFCLEILCQRVFLRLWAADVGIKPFYSNGLLTASVDLRRRRHWASTTN